jgi:acyl-CoA synthetase
VTQPAAMSPTAVFPPGTGPVPASPHERYVADRLSEVGRWGTATLAETIAEHARSMPDAPAFITADQRMSWAEYDSTSTVLAGLLVACGLERGARVGVFLPDGPAVHAVYVAAEKAGLVVVGVGPRAGAREVRHILGVAGATALVTFPEHRGASADGLVADLRAGGVGIDRHVCLDPADLTGSALVDGAATPLPTRAEAEQVIAGRALGIGEIFLINSTSGTTGLPKCVVHNQNRWFYYHSLAVEAGEMTSQDVFMSVIPTPFGFGIWTTHVTPALLGCPTVLMDRFDAAGAIELIARERVTILACVSTQFVMMLNSGAVEGRDLASLRSMFTGGEAVPFERSAEFEERVGAKVLQFYGSNETGALSRTRTTDTRDQRLRTAGRVIDDMQVRLLDDEGRDVTTAGVPGQAACAGPATCFGYFDDADANRQLFTDDGWMLTGDICTLDVDGYLTVVGRKSDFIIRGGKNISAVYVEEEVATHPSVAMAAAVAMPDPVFGERVCVYVVPTSGHTVDLSEVTAWLDKRGVSKESWPERVELVEELPRSSGGKIAKGALRDDIKRRMAMQPPG